MKSNLKLFYIITMKFRNILIIILSILLIAACGVVKPVVPGPSNNVNVRDSIVYNIIDSTVYHPVEVIKDIVPQYDTLHMSTSLAEAQAYVDTSLHVLRGSIKNKEGYTQKIKYVDRIEYRDSIQVVKEPYPVEIEKKVKTHYWYEKILWFFAVIGLTWIVKICIKLYAKFKGA